MKKQPLLYKNQVIGYIDYINYVDNKIYSIDIYLFKNDLYHEILENIKRGKFATFDKEPNLENVYNNNLYNINLENDLLTLKLKI